MKHVTTLGLLIIFILTSLVAGCGEDKKTAGTAGQALVLTVGTTMPVGGINIEDSNFEILQTIFTHNGLVKLDRNGQFVGDLAKSWQTTDGQTWVFNLYDNLAWHDGAKLTAHDIKFTIEYSIESRPEYKSHFALIKSVTAPDDKTLVITLSEPNPRFLVNISVLRTLPQHIFAAVDNPATFNDPKAAIGSGPYRFEKFDQNAGLITFKANSAYHRGAPLVPEIKVRLFRNPEALYMALQNGEIDLPYKYSGGIESIYADNLAKNEKFKLINVPNLGVSKALIFNVVKPVVNDTDVRIALSYAIDYNELVRLFAARSGMVPAAGFVPSGTPGYAATRQMEFNPDKARQLLDKAGYLPAADGTRAKNGQTLTFEVTVRNDVPEDTRLSELLQKYFTAIGVKLKIKPVDITLFRTISDKDRSHTSLLTRTTPWGMLTWAGLGSGYIDARNIGWAMVDDAEFKAIVDKMNSALDPEDYKQYSAELQRYYADNLPALPLYWENFIQPLSAAWTGWIVNPVYGVLNEETWYSLQKN